MYEPTKSRIKLQTFGHLIRNKIQQNELSVDLLAKEASVNRATILKIISGGNTTMITVLKIADAMSLDLGELFDELDSYNDGLYF